jgi:hypothetical protein
MRREAALDAAANSPEYRPQPQPVFEFADGQPSTVHYVSLEPVQREARV